MEKIVFENGLQLLFEANEGSKSVALGVFVKAGAIDEDSRKQGISHFLEHTTFKGTKKRNHFEIANEFDSMGVSYNAYTDVDHTCYYFKSITTNLEKATEILSDIFYNSTYKKEEIEKERLVILQEYNDEFDDPEFLVLKNLLNGIFPKYLGRNVIGNEKTINAITRDEIVEYKEKYYTPENTIIAISGGISLDEAKKLVEKYFVTKGKPAKRKDLIREKFVSCHNYQQKEVQQAQVNIAFYAGEATIDRVISNIIISFVFGLQMSSRLFQKVRDELGLCYAISGGTQTVVKDTIFLISLSTEYKKVAEATRAIREEINKFVEFGMTEKELQTAKEQAKSKYIFADESNYGRVSTVANQQFRFNKVWGLEEKIKAVDNITIDEINKRIKEIFVYDNVGTSLLCSSEDIDLRKILIGEN